MIDHQSDIDSPDIHVDRQGSHETVPAEVDTRIEILNTRFFFHELLKESQNTRHYIVEDIEVDIATLNDPEAPLFYYLKQLTFKTKAEYNFARKYYIKIYNYCKMPFAKSDIVKLNHMFDFDNEDEEYFELVLIYDYGEADRIDVENISATHINKFLKNVCLLLNDLAKFDQIYHGNVSLKNIILVNNELKLSGFKSRYLDDFGVKNWKIDLAKDYGVYRLDLFLIGLLWLVFLDVDVNMHVSKDMSFENVRKNIRKIIKELPHNKTMEIVVKLLDLDNHPGLTLEEIIMDFDEQYILENIKTESSKEYNTNTDCDYGSNPTNLFGDMGSNNNINVTPSQRHLRKNHSKDTNLFMKPYGESERDIMNYRIEEEQTAKLHDSNEPNNMIKLSGLEFTLRDDNSVAQIRPNGEDVITIKDGNGSLPREMDDIYDLNHSGFEDNRRQTLDPGFNKTEKQLLANNRHNSEKQLLRHIEEPNNNDKPSLRKLKSNAVISLSDKEMGSKKIVNPDVDNDLSDIKQEVLEEASEDENFDKVYSYKNVESEFNSTQRNKDAETHKSNGIVENRYNTGDNSDEEESYRSVNTKDEPMMARVAEVQEEIILDDESPKTFQNQVIESIITKKGLETIKPEDLYINESTDNIYLLDESEGNLLEGIDVSSENIKPILTETIMDDKVIEFPEHVGDNCLYNPLNAILSTDDHVDSEIIDVLFDSRARNHSHHKNSNPQLDLLSEHMVSNRNNMPTTDLKESIEIISRSKNVRESNNTKTDNNKPEPENTNILSNNKVNFYKKQSTLERLSDDSESLESRPDHKKGVSHSKNRFNSNMNEKTKSRDKSKIEDVSRPLSEWDYELKKEEETRARNEKIQLAILKEAERNRKEVEERKKIEREALIIKETERLKKDQELKARISQKAQLNIRDKNNNKSATKTMSRPDTNMSPQSKHSNNDVEQFISLRRQVDNDKSATKSKTNKKEKGQDTTRQYVSLKKATTPSENDNKPSLEDIDKMMKKAVKMTSPLDRKNLFLVKETTGDTKSFKKVLMNQKSRDRNSLDKTAKDNNIVQRVPTNSPKNRENMNFADSHNIFFDKPVELQANGQNQPFTIDANSQQHEDLRQQQKVDLLLRQAHFDSFDNTISPRKQEGSNQTVKRKVGNIDETNDNDGKKQESRKVKAKRPLTQSYIDEPLDKSAVLNRSQIHTDRPRISQRVRESNTCKRGPINRTVNSSLDNSIIGQNVVNINDNDNEFNRQISEIQLLIEKKSYEDSLMNLCMLLKKVTNIKKVTLYKMIASVYFKLKNHIQCIATLNCSLEYLDSIESLQDKAEIKRGFLLSLSISLIELKKYDEALFTLHDPVFADKSNVPFAYYSLIGDAYRDLGKTEEAYTAYENQLKYFMSRELNEKSIRGLFLLVSKTVITLNTIGDDVRIVKFYRRMLSVVEGLVKVDAAYKNSQQEYSVIKEHVVLSILNTLMLKENYGIVNYILNDIVTSNLLVYDRLYDDDKIRYVDIFLQFSEYLKNYPNFGDQKECYIKYLIKSHKILKLCDPSDAISRKKLIITFNKGLFYLKEKDYTKAKRAFDDAVKTYIAKFAEPDSEIFALLFNIALKLHNSQQYIDSAYFFEKILTLKCPEDYMRNKSIKLLSKTYYRLGEYQKGYNLLAGWVLKDLDAKDKRARNFYKYLSIYYLCYTNTRFTDFEPVMVKLRAQSEIKAEIEPIHYFNIFFNLSYLASRNKNYKQNEKLVSKVMEIVKQRSKKTFGKDFVETLTSIYNNYVLNKNYPYFSPKDFIMTLYRPHISIEDNVINFITFLINFTLVSMNKLPTNPEKGPDEKLRHYFMDYASKIRKNVNLYNFVMDNIIEALKHIETNGENEDGPKLEIRDLKPDTVVLDGVKISNYISLPRVSMKTKINEPARIEMKSKKVIVQPSTRVSQKIVKSETMLKTPVKRHVKGAMNKTIESKKLPKVTSEVCVTKSNLKDINACLCSEYAINNKELVLVVKNAISVLKRDTHLLKVIDFSIFLDKLEETFKLKKIIWDKYTYIRNLIKFHIGHDAGVIDRVKFIELLESLIIDLPLCIHDYKIIIRILESFRDKYYIEILLTHLDSFHPSIVKMLITELIVNHFELMYLKVKTELFKQITTTEAFEVANNPYINIINPDGKLNLDRQYHITIRRYGNHAVLNDKALQSTFNKYIPPQELESFYLRYTIYNAVVDLLSLQFDEIDIVSCLNANLLKLINMKNTSNKDAEFFIYDILLVAYLLKFSKNKITELSKILLEMINLAKERSLDTDAYHIALVASLIGNLIYRRKNTDNTTKAKLIALDAIKNLKGDEIYFPSFYPQTDIKSVVFGIFSTLFVISYSASKKDAIDKHYNKAVKIPIDNYCLKIDQSLIEVLYLTHIKDFEAVRQKLIKIQGNLTEGGLNGVEADLYGLIVSKISLDASIAGGKYADINRKKDKYDKAFKQLKKRLASGR